jgi:hypothetical protein
VPAVFAIGDRVHHDERIAGVETAGQIRRAGQWHDGGIVAHAPVAEAFTHVAIDVECLSRHWPYSNVASSCVD